MITENITVTITTPSDREAVVTREFNAPAALVFDAVTKADLIKRWYGAHASLDSCESDPRIGGSWRFAFTAGGKQMAKLLGYDVTKADACLACHAAVVKDDKLKDPTFKIQEGVNCVVCHGPYGEWVDAHASTLGKKREDFRKKSRTVKEHEYGMTDLWDPLKRAELCASCHVGNAKEGKLNKKKKSNKASKQATK